MCCASLPSSRAVTFNPGSCRPVALVNVDLVKPDLARALGHHHAEDRLVAGQSLGERDAGVVARLDDDAAQKVVDLHPAVDRREHAGGARRRAARAPGVLADDDFIVERDIALLDLVEHELGGHQLGERSGIDQFVGGTSRTGRCRFRPRSGWRAARWSGNRRPSSARRPGRQQEGSGLQRLSKQNA